MKISTDKVSFYRKSFQFINRKILFHLSTYSVYMSMSIPKTQWKMPDRKVMNEKAQVKLPLCVYMHNYFITTLTWRCSLIFSKSHDLFSEKDFQ